MDTDGAERVAGWRLKVGKIHPTVCDYPNNFSAMAPAGVRLVAATTGATSFDREDVARARERRRETALALDEWGVDCIIAGGGPLSTLEGAEAEERFVESVRSAVSVPFVPSPEAQVDALAALGAESILLVTPFPDDRDAETRAYLEARGFDVAAVGGLSLPRPGDVRDYPPTIAYQCATRLAARTETAADAISIACAPFGSVEYVERIERDAGVPVVTSAQAQLWKAFELGGIRPDLSGYGSLFEA